eukprot:TRINITY_DN59437_c0_g1_i1.p1 TRINITY_DN59437_c0_g1~~TRINITY_DN59437_c0_g1_i1.p1  ORF type:complete len:542 (+),score=47.20 TRINITY_DN59437_c0_g1_i1:102-1628(+)
MQTCCDQMIKAAEGERDKAKRDIEKMREEFHIEEERRKSDIVSEEERLQRLEDQFNARMAAANEAAEASQYLIKLNIGGTEFTTTKHTLLKEPDTFFHAMLRSGSWQPDHGESYFVDRNARFFQDILDYLRDGELYLTVDKLGEDDCKRFKADVEYYQIDSLLAMLCDDPPPLMTFEQINTVAGNGMRSFGGDGSLATQAAFNIPSGICVSSEGKLYIADRYNHRVRLVDLHSGLISTIVGDGTPGYCGDGGPATQARITGPVRVAVGSGKLFIADCNTECVRSVDLQTNIIDTIAGTGFAGHSGDGNAAKVAQLDGPRGLAVYKDSLYIADSNNHCVRAVDLHTGIISTVAGCCKAGFAGDGGVAIDAQLNRPRDIALADDVLFISDCNNYRIRVVDLNTKIIRTLVGTGARGYSGDGGPVEKAELKWPLGLAVHEKKLFIADNCAHCVRVVDLTKRTINTLCGSGAQGCSGDGAAPTSAQLANPIGLGVWNAKLYISGPHCIRVVS